LFDSTDREGDSPLSVNLWQQIPYKRLETDRAPTGANLQGTSGIAARKA